MSAHQNNTNSSSTINTPTATKPPSSPVKFGSKSKSRHSSTSDSACGTPTGGSGSVGSGSTAGTPNDEKAHSIRVTRKIFNNWRSACGRTKDKTKDFIRRWKTLPENQSELEAGDSGSDQPHQVGGGMDQPGSGAPTISSTTSNSISNTPASVATNTSSGIGSTTDSTTQQNSSSAGTATTKSSSSGFGKIRSLTKKFSQDIPSEDLSTSSISQSKPSAGWSVHVWGKFSNCRQII